MKPFTEVRTGAPVWVTIRKNGYWKGTMHGNFVGWTKTGRALIEGRNGKRAYSADAVQLKGAKA